MLPYKSDMLILHISPWKWFFPKEDESEDGATMRMMPKLKWRLPDTHTQLSQSRPWVVLSVVVLSNILFIMP